MALARRLHILGAYWGFLLMSIRLGLHWNMILRMVKRQLKLKPSKARSTVLSLACAVIAAYGIYIFISRDFASYLFLKSEFVFLDYSESKLLFYWDYLMLMGLCILIAHYGSRRLIRKKETKL